MNLQRTATETAPHVAAGTVCDPVVRSITDPDDGGDAPLVSVVIPTCGRPALLSRCLQALRRQRFVLPAANGVARAVWVPFEVIVVDDAHSDTTQRQVGMVSTLMQPHVTLRYLRPSRGKGPAVARNAGWRAARSELIAFTDDDTVPAPDWIAQGVLSMRQRQCAALGGRVVVPRPRHGRRRPTDHELMTRGLEAAEFVTANAFVWRDALVRVDGFDERFRRAWREDSDLQFRLQAQVGPVGRCDAAVVEHPVRPERWGVSLRQQKNVFFDALLYRKHPRLYRARVRRTPPWDYYAIVAASLASAAAAAGLPGAAVAPGLAALALGLVLRLAWRRLRTTSRAPAHVGEMLFTSALIPFLSVYWRLRGAAHFRVWFL